MAIRNIVQNGDEILIKKCRPVTDFNPRLHELLDDMKETLAQADGVGLAAPQVGVLRSCAVVLLEDGTFLELINPVIEKTEGTQEDVEGCLSFPGVWGVVMRPNKVTVRAQDRNGNFFEQEGEGLTARAFCHEIDHLNGHVFTELVSEFVEPKEYMEDQGA